MVQLIKGLLLCVFFYFFSSNIFAQSQENKTDFYLTISTHKKHTPIDGINDFVRYRIDNNLLQKIINTKEKELKVAIEIKATTSVLQLTEVDITSPTYLLQLGNGGKAHSNGTKYYRGQFADDPQSRVALSINGNHLKLLLATQHQEFIIHKYRDEYIGYYKNELEYASKGHCLTPDIEGYDTQLKSKNLKSNQPTSPVDIYIECDYQSYLDHNSDIADTEFWATSLFNEVASLYENDGINIQLSGMKIWNTPDPYQEEIGIVDMLSKFGATIQNNYNGRLAHLLTSRFGGGVAHLNVLCDSYNPGSHAGPYGLSAGLTTSITQAPDYSWNVYVIAHEIGHNIGSPHTHSCVWGQNHNTAIDNCANDNGCDSGDTPQNGGTIMSYCHTSPTGVNFSNGFGEEPSNLLRDKIAIAGCLVELTNDECSQAEELIVYNQVTQNAYSNFEATSSTGHPNFSCGNAGSAIDVWFELEVPSSGNVTIEVIEISGGLYDMIMEAYSGNCNSLSSIACSDDEVGRMPLLNLTGRNPGEIILIRIIDYRSDDFGTFGLAAYDDSGIDPTGNSNNPPLSDCTHETIEIIDDINTSQNSKVKNSVYISSKAMPEVDLYFTFGAESVLAPGFEITQGSTLEINNRDCKN